MSVYATNWHTSYCSLLAKCFSKLNVVGGWDFDQRNLPDSVRISSWRDIVRDLLSNRDATLIANSVPRDMLLILLVATLGGRVVGVVHGQATRGGGAVRTACKRLFYQAVQFLLRSRFRYVCIQSEVARSFGFKDYEIVEPMVEFAVFSQPRKPPRRFVIVANDFSRSHFDKNLPRALIEAGEEVVLVGKGNRDFQGQGFSVIECADQTAYIGVLSVGGFYLNVLCEPEAPYNLGFLEAVSFGLPCVQLARRDMLPSDGDAFLVKQDALSSDQGGLCRDLIGWADSSDAIASVGRLQRKVVARFGVDRFVSQWREIIYGWH